MKKLISLVLLFAAMGAQARSVMPTLLQYENQSRLMGGVSHTLKVYANGTVVHREFAANPSFPSQWEVVTVLGNRELTQIQRLIRRSTPEIIMHEVSLARCFMRATYIEKFTAMNDSIFLREGAVCDGGFRVNVRPAAKRLVEILSTLESSYHQRLPRFDIENALGSIVDLE